MRRNTTDLQSPCQEKIFVSFEIIHAQYFLPIEIRLCPKDKTLFHMTLSIYLLLPSVSGASNIFPGIPIREVE
jgi:hypothetical protein